MKAVRVSELKAQLSSYLRRVKRGERFIVLDRSEPVAELIPAPRVESAAEGLVRDGRVQAPTGTLRALRFSALECPVSVAELLDAVREDRL
jgi:prevent-host-death family protein